ncbi:MAG: transposase [Lewinellaceae bacterium]|nr:transposase [Lewinellaceae bacterium]
MAGYRILHQGDLHFVTLTITGWIDLFTRQCYRDIVIDNLRYCQARKGLQVFAFVIMSNHIHLIVQANAPAKLSAVLRDFKKYTAVKFLEAIREKPESRHEWILSYMALHAMRTKRSGNYQVWINGNAPIQLVSPAFIVQKLNYIHYNPVKAGIVEKPEDYIYSSASNYIQGKGILNVTVLDVVHLR